MYEKLSEICGRPLVDMDTCTPYCAQWLWCRCQGLWKSNPRVCIGPTCLFKGPAARREDLQSMQQTLQIEEYVFLWYVPTRWVTLAKVLQRIIQQMPVIVEMWKEFAKLDAKNQPHSTTYRTITSKLQKKCSLCVQLEFIMSVSTMFVKYLVLFQREQPLTHFCQVKCKPW